MTDTVQPSKTRLRGVNIALALAIMLVPTVVASRPAQAQTFTVLYSFTGGADGGSPYAGLIRDSAGNLYGTTLGGGACGNGTVFMLNKTGKETVLYSFTGGADGAGPFAGLVRDAAGNLYSTTIDGGSSSACQGHACGVVFKLDESGNETVLYSFNGGADGEYPYAGLVRDAKGDLYGTTAFGGGGGCPNYFSGCGTVFKLDATGEETVLYSFTGTGGDGAYPYAGLVLDAAGNLYGTTAQGGTYACNYGENGCGTVFKLDKTGKETVLYTVTDTHGAYPYAGLVRDAASNLYGTTLGGDGSGRGRVFKLDKAGKETVLHSFTGTGGDGEYPYAGLVRDAKGNLYGTTWSGGTHGSGTVFELDKTGKETVLYSFTGGADGAWPWAGLALDANGNLYGTTVIDGASGYGTVFELTP
jgi:uncharacterized repeat protein (TIGR03803 family)